MKLYSVVLSRTAAKFIEKVPPKIYTTIRQKIDALANDPHPYYAQQLVGHKGLFKIRVGEYRIIYTVHHNVLQVLIADIDHRSKVYKKF